MEEKKMCFDLLSRTGMKLESVWRNKEEVGLITFPAQHWTPPSDHWRKFAGDGKLQSPHDQAGPDSP
jgi:hypothetical protein